MQLRYNSESIYEITPNSNGYEMAPNCNVPLYSSGCVWKSTQKLSNFISIRFSIIVTCLLANTSAREQGTWRSHIMGRILYSPVSSPLKSLYTSPPWHTCSSRTNSTSLGSIQPRCVLREECEGYSITFLPLSINSDILERYFPCNFPLVCASIMLPWLQS